MQADTFDALVDAVIAHRLGNRIAPSDRKSVADDVDNFICSQMRGTKALWQFCTTRFQLPVAQTSMSVRSAPSAPSNVRKRKLCPTCGNR